MVEVIACEMVVNALGQERPPELSPDWETCRVAAGVGRDGLRANRTGRTQAAGIFARAI